MIGQSLREGPRRAWGKPSLGPASKWLPVTDHQQCLSDIQTSYTVAYSAWHSMPDCEILGTQSYLVRRFEVQVAQVAHNGQHGGDLPPSNCKDQSLASFLQHTARKAKVPVPGRAVPRVTVLPDRSVSSRRGPGATLVEGRLDFDRASPREQRHVVVEGSCVRLRVVVASSHRVCMKTPILNTKVHKSTFLT